MTATEHALESDRPLPRGATEGPALTGAVGGAVGGAPLTGYDAALGTAEALERLGVGVVIAEPVVHGHEPVTALRILWTNDMARRVRGPLRGTVLSEESLPGVAPVVAAARVAWVGGSGSVLMDNDDRRVFPFVTSQRLEIRFNRVGDVLVGVLIDRDGERHAARRLDALASMLDAGVAVMVPSFADDGLVALDVLSTNPSHERLWEHASAGDRVAPAGHAALYDAVDTAWHTGRTATFRIDDREHRPPRMANVQVERSGGVVLVVTHDESELAEHADGRLRAEDLLQNTLRQLPEQTALCRPILVDGEVVDAVVVANNQASERDGSAIGRRTSEVFRDPSDFVRAARTTWRTDLPVRYRLTSVEPEGERIFEACVSRCGDLIVSSLTDRTAEVLARRALNESDRRYRLTAEALPLGLALLRCTGDPDASEPQIVYANPALEDVVGAGPLAGRPASEAFPLWDMGRDLLRRSWGHPGAVERLAVDNIGQRLSVDLPSCALLLEARRFDDEVLVVMIDRTAESTASHELAVANERFAHVFDALDTALIVLDEHGEVVFHNQPARRLAEVDRPITRADLRQIEVHDAAGRRLPLSETPGARARATGEPVDGAVLQLRYRPTGGTMWAKVSARPLPQANGATGLLLSCTDITDRLAAEERFRSTVDALAESVALYEPVLGADGELVDARMVYMNPAARSFRATELPDGFLVSEHFHDAERAIATIREVWRTGRAGHYSVDNSGPVRDPDLLPSHFDATIYRADRLLIIVAMDHSKAVAGARALATAEDRFASTIEALEEELAVFSPVLGAAGELVDLRIEFGNRTWHNQREEAIDASAHLLVSDYYVDAPHFLDAARRAWQTRERVRYVLNNPDRRPYPQLLREHIEFSIIRVGDEVVSIGLDRSAEQATLRRFRDIAAHDQETGLLSQAGLAGRLTEMLEAGSTIGLVVIEVGLLEQVQRTYGLRAAEVAVREIAARLAQRLPGLPVARVGSATFVAAFPGVRRTAEIVGAADDLVALLQRPVDAAGLRLRLDASSGAVLSPLHGTDADTLVRRAKSAAWNALRSRLACCVWSPQLEQQTPTQEVALLSEIDRGLARGEFYLDYQPKLSLPDHRLAGAEALVRWKHPERGIVPPAAFIPLIEDSTLARPFTERVIAMAVDAWKREPRLAGLRVAVNLPAVLINDPALVESVSDALVDAGVPASILELEITERGLVGDDAVARANLSELRNLGVHLAIDDFGTGAASLSYLRWLPVESVKIDRTFVRDLEHDAINRSVVEACVTVARALDLAIVAEGVENETEARVAAELGCTYAQGYLYGRPGPLHKLLDLAPPA